jgi:hypothetical protein
MSTVSPNLSLPYIQQNQAQKHVTHNEGMRLLDGVGSFKPVLQFLAQLKG